MTSSNPTGSNPPQDPKRAPGPKAPGDAPNDLTSALAGAGDNAGLRLKGEPNAAPPAAPAGSPSAQQQRLKPAPYQANPSMWQQAPPPPPPPPPKFSAVSQIPKPPPVEAITGKAYTMSRSMPAFSDGPTEEELEFNAGLDVAETLAAMGFKGDAVYHDGNAYRIFCPIHHDQIRRSMIVEPERRSFKCTLKSCPGHAGGTILELYARINEMSLPEARRRLSKGAVQTSAVELESAAEGQRLMEAGHYAEALPLMQQAVELAPKDATTRCQMAALQLEMGLRDEGIANYLIAAEDFGVRGDLEKTMQIYNLLVLMSPNDYDIHEQMAYIAARLGNIEDAIGKLKWITNAMIERGNYDAAILRMDRMIELKPTATEFLEMKAELLIAADRTDAGAQHVALSVQRLVEKGSLPGAYRLAQKGLELFPMNDLLKLLYDEVASELKKMGLDVTAFAAEAAAGGAAATAADDDDDDFRDWIAELEDEIVPDRVTSRRMVAIEPMAEDEAAEAAAVGADEATNKMAAMPEATPADRPSPHATPASPNQTAEILAGDDRVALCRDSLTGATSDERMRMYAHLRTMYAEVKKSYADGTLSDFEKRVIKEFYKSFCVAFKESNAEAGGDTMLTKF